MANPDIFDAFNTCIDRINAGETLDSCLADYPEHADRLRQLLTTGQWVYRAQQYPNAEISADRTQSRARLFSRNQKSKSPPPNGNRKRWLYRMAALTAATILVFVGVIALFSPMGNGKRLSSIELTSAAITDRNSTTVALLQASQTSVAQLIDPAVIMAPIIIITLAPPTLPENPDAALIPTSVMLMSPQPFGTPLPTLSTFVMQEFSLPTAAVGATMQPVFPTPTPALSATPLPIPAQILSLNAGEIDDNARWDNYLQYRQNYLQALSSTVHDIDVTGRQIIRVTDRNGFPVLGARVVVLVGETFLTESRTYSNGQTLFFPNANPLGRGAQSYRVQIEKDSAMVEFTLIPGQSSIWNVTLDGVNPPRTPAQMDILFLLDSTGSMADEISVLQNNILGISSQIAQFSGNAVDVHYGLVTYRDRGDAYITRIFDFVPDVHLFQNSLSSIQADAGGDTPESLNEALHAAVQNVSWRSDEAIKLIFLVADAPPHLDYGVDYDYAQEMMVAAGHGIKIHPIASSGLDPSGEYIFRQLAQYTLGHFIFLTYDQGTSGTPGDSRPDLSVGEAASPANQNQGDYTVERLDELVLRLINDELIARNTRLTDGIGSFPTLYPPTCLPPPSYFWTPTPHVQSPENNALPPTITPTFTPSPTYTPTFSIQSTKNDTLPTNNLLSALSPLMIASLVVAGGVFVYSINSRHQPPKRKNYEIIEPTD